MTTIRNKPAVAVKPSAPVTPGNTVVGKPRRMAMPVSASPATKATPIMPGSSTPFEVVEGIENVVPYIKVLIYGDYGVGKSVLAAQSVDVEEMRDVIILDVEGGIKSAFNSEAVANYSDISVVRITNYQQFVAVTAFLRAHCDARDINDVARMEHLAQQYGFNPTRRFYTVVVDSIYELDGMNFRRLIGDQSDNLMQCNQSDDLRGDYGRNRQIIHKGLRTLRDLPMNVIFTAPVDRSKDEHTKKIEAGPMLTGKLSNDIQGFMDVVGYLVAAQGRDTPVMTPVAGKQQAQQPPPSNKLKRRLWLQSVGPFAAKCRLAPQHVTHIDDPTMYALYGSMHSV